MYYLFLQPYRSPYVSNNYYPGYTNRGFIGVQTPRAPYYPRGYYPPQPQPQPRSNARLLLCLIGSVLAALIILGTVGAIVGVVLGTLFTLVYENIFIFKDNRFRKYVF